MRHLFLLVLSSSLFVCESNGQSEIRLYLRTHEKVESPIEELASFKYLTIDDSLREGDYMDVYITSHPNVISYWLALSRGSSRLSKEYQQALIKFSQTLVTFDVFVTVVNTKKDLTMYLIHYISGVRQ